MPPKRSERRRKKTPAPDPPTDSEDDDDSDSDDDSDDNNSDDEVRPPPPQRKRHRRAAARGNKKRAKRAALETFYLVSEDTNEIEPNACYKGKCSPTIVDCAVKLAKKAWGRNKHLGLVTLEHQATGTRYTFDSNDWCDRSGGKPKFCSNRSTDTQPLHITTSGRNNGSKSQRSTGLTPTLGRLNM